MGDGMRRWDGRWVTEGAVDSNMAGNRSAVGLEGNGWQEKGWPGYWFPTACGSPISNLL